MPSHSHAQLLDETGLAYGAENLAPTDLGGTPAWHGGSTRRAGAGQGRCRSGAALSAQPPAALPCWPRRALHADMQEEAEGAGILAGGASGVGAGAGEGALHRLSAGAKELAHEVKAELRVRQRPCRCNPVAAQTDEQRGGGAHRGFFRCAGGASARRRARGCVWCARPSCQGALRRSSHASRLVGPASLVLLVLIPLATCVLTLQACIVCTPGE